MTYHLSYALIHPQQRSQIVFSLAHFKATKLKVLVSGQKQKIFFSDILGNVNYPNITFFTFREYNQKIRQGQTLVLMQVPETFQIMQIILKLGNPLLLLGAFNKKYIKMIEKKLDVKSEKLEFSSNKFVGINTKIRQLVQSSYDLNRASFYAYGQYINNYRANLLKKIFRTQLVDVNKLALSFGFATPPRVKQGKFITSKALKEKIHLKKNKKEKKQKKNKAQQLKQSNITKQVLPSKKSKKIKKIK